MCAKRTNSKKSVFETFPVFLNRWFPLLVVCLFLVNCILVFLALVSSKPRIVVHYHETTNTLYRVLSVTQWLDNAGSVLPASFQHDTDSKSETADTKEVSASFDYFEINGFPGFRYLDRIYYIGSITSLGIVKEIYPDKVVCSNGSFVLARGSFQEPRSRTDDLGYLKKGKQ